MQIEEWNGTKRKKIYDDIDDMFEDAKREAKNPNVKKITLTFPKKIIPSKRRKK